MKIAPVLSSNFPFSYDIYCNGSLLLAVDGQNTLSLIFHGGLRNHNTTFATHKSTDIVTHNL